jgi:hypothetical protein
LRVYYHITSRPDKLARINKNAPGQFTKNRGKFKLALAQFGVDEKVCGGIGRNPFPIPAKNV